MAFEDNLKELESIVQTMERGSLSIDETIRAFERGRALVKVCQDDLKSIQLKIEKVMKDGTTEELKV